MHGRIAVGAPAEIPARWRDTPVGELLAYHNCGVAHAAHDRARILICACMDHRLRLNVPDRFAYLIRVGGALVDPSADSVAVAVALGGVEHIVVIGHTDCTMADLPNRVDELVDGLARQGWERDAAVALAERNAALVRGLGPEDLAWSEAERLDAAYPAIDVVPMVYDVVDHLLYLLEP